MSLEDCLWSDDDIESFESLVGHPLPPQGTKVQCGKCGCQFDVVSLPFEFVAVLLDELLRAEELSEDDDASRRAASFQADLLARAAKEEQQVLKSLVMKRLMKISDDVTSALRAMETRIDLDVQKELGLRSPVTALNLALGKVRALRKAGIATIRDLVRRARQDLMSIPGLTEDDLRHFEEGLRPYELHLEMSLEELP